MVKEEEYINAGYKEEQSIASKDLEVHFIELPKYRKKNPKCDTSLEQWLCIIIGENEEKIKMAESKNKEIKKMVEIMDTLSLDKKEREEYEAREKLLMDIRVGNACAREEGKKEGKQERNIEIAKSMLIKNIDIQTISEITGLTKKEIEKFK